MILEMKHVPLFCQDEGVIIDSVCIPLVPFGEMTEKGAYRALMLLLRENPFEFIKYLSNIDEC